MLTCRVRNFELIKLQWKDVKMGLQQNGFECFQIFLSQRKGWQKKTDKGIKEQDLRSVPTSRSDSSVIRDLTLILAQIIIF